MPRITISLFLLLVCSYSSAIVARHDIDESKYHVKDNPPQYLIDVPREGHAVLISDRWLLTVGHVMFGDYQGMNFDMSGVKNKISEVIFHPKYIQPPADFNYSNTAKLKTLLSTRSDTALVKLAHLVKHLVSITLCSKNDKQGSIPNWII